MEQFAHLRLVTKKTGLAAIPGGGKEPPETKANKANRRNHSRNLQRWITDIKSEWETDFLERAEKGLAPLDKDVVTVFFKINPNLLLPTFDLEAFGIEIISEEEGGFIIGASSDNFRSLEEKIAGFIRSEHSTGKVADLWQIMTGDRESWRTEHILSQGLLDKWAEIKDDDQFTLEVSIAFAKPLGAKPDPTKKGGIKRLEKFEALQEEREAALSNRHDHFIEFVSNYGRIINSLIDLGDSFGTHIEISGKGLKDLVKNYPFVFEIVEVEEVALENSIGQETEIDGFGILPPLKGSPVVGIIDSGIMEEHKYLSAAIDPGRSVSYVKDDPSTADHVQRGGHGTKVAGALLFPNGISSLTAPYSPPCFARNLRILDANNSLQNQYPAELMQQIVHSNDDCKIFNLSVNSRIPFRLKHMSSWASVIDKLTHEKDILFVLSVGNIPRQAVKDYLQRHEPYPDYLQNSHCRTANPAQSSFAISVGSIDNIDFEDTDWKTVGKKDSVSSYSRVGQGIWGHIKPDLVECGGEFVTSKDGSFRMTSKPETCPELIRSTLHGGSAVGRSDVGTSYSAPKVTHIASILKNLYPDEGTNLIRALLVQGARLPGDLLYSPNQDAIKQLGYGVPSLDRVVRNTDYRVTYYSTSSIAATAAHLYSLRIPESLRNPGNEFDVLIEVTLAYTSKVRRTRQKLKSYLGTWLDWTSSRLDDDFDVFSERAIKPDDGETSDSDTPETEQVIGWKIRERKDWGEVEGVNRNKSSLQKDWVILKSHELPEELSFCVRGHKGWDKNFEEIPYAFTVSIELLGLQIPIYEEIKAENTIEIEHEVRI